MSSIAYRDWNIWINKFYFDSGEEYSGFYECVLLPTLMTQQTIEYLAENYDIYMDNIVHVSKPSLNIITKCIHTQEGNLCLRIYGNLNTKNSIENIIHNIIKKIDAISLCVDASLICNEIRFNCFYNGQIFITNRKPMGRSMAFEIEERSSASIKLKEDLSYYSTLSDDNQKVGAKHYLTGLTLLGLEDQVTGLIDAAFMQFYQGCEALCRDPKGNLDGSKKYIASLNLSDNQEIQIIAHQVWKVRHKYFGHGDVKYNLLANMNADNATRVAKQVLVVRYLCRRLLDSKVPSNQHLIREMHLFTNKFDSDFRGTISELENEFRVDFDIRDIKIYDANGKYILHKLN